MNAIRIRQPLILGPEQELLPNTMGWMAPAPDGAKMSPFKVDERERRSWERSKRWADLAKSVFQVHAVDAEGQVVVRRQVRRRQLVKFFAGLPPCLIGMEACATAHYSARELTALGYEVRLMPPAYVKPYVKRQKNDAADAEAICEAVTRPTMRFVPVKSPEQQSAAMLHRSRALLVKQRTMLLHAIRAHLAELGIATGAGVSQVTKMVGALVRGDPLDLPDLARVVLETLAQLVFDLQERLRTIDKQLAHWHYTNDLSNQLETIPGIGLVTASALASSIPDPNTFRSGRHFAAWLGLVPKQNSSGGKTRLGRISKQGNKYLRQLLILGATSVLRYLRREGSNPPP
jgi:transposase